MSTKSGGTAKPEETGTRTRRYIRRSREEVVLMAEGHSPAAYEEWQRKAPPATLEELQEMEELMRLREAAREASLAAELGMYVSEATHMAPAADEPSL
jgi:hypothetical protein